MLHVDVDYGFGLYLFGRLHEWLEIGCWFYYYCQYEDNPPIAYSRVNHEMVIALKVNYSIASFTLGIQNDEFRRIRRQV